MSMGSLCQQAILATEVHVRCPEGLRVDTPRYPQTRAFRIEALNEEFQVFEGDVVIVVPLVWAFAKEQAWPFMWSCVIRRATTRRVSCRLARS